jgi:MFS family permease
MSVSSIGSLTGSITLLNLHRTGRRMRLTLGVVAVTAALIAMARTNSFFVAAACMVLLSVGASTCIGLANIIVQERAPDHLRGRVSAVAGICLFGLFPMATVLVTCLADQIGMRVTIFSTATIYALCSLAVLALVGHQFSAPLPIAAENPILETETQAVSEQQV